MNQIPGARRGGHFVCGAGAITGVTLPADCTEILFRPEAVSLATPGPDADRQGRGNVLPRRPHAADGGRNRTKAADGGDEWIFPARGGAGQSRRARHAADAGVDGAARPDPAGRPRSIAQVSRGARRLPRPIRRRASPGPCRSCGSRRSGRRSRSLSVLGPAYTPGSRARSSWALRSAALGPGERRQTEACATKNFDRGKWRLVSAMIGRIARIVPRDARVAVVRLCPGATGSA